MVVLLLWHLLSLVVGDGMYLGAVFDACFALASFWFVR